MRQSGAPRMSSPRGTSPIFSAGSAALWDGPTTRTSSSSASSSATTYTEDEVEELETVMGDLTDELAEVKKLRKHDEAEYDRTRQAVAGFRLT